MRKQVALAGVFAAVLALQGAAGAEVTTETGASLLVFPKVISNGTRETIVQLANLSNSMVRAHCFYVNAQLAKPDEPEGPFNRRLWQEIDFTIVLTKQQPTHWTVRRGRRPNPFDAPCSRGDGVCIDGPDVGDSCAWHGQCTDSLCSNTGCIDAGFDPGLIPPVLPGFEGELKCVEVDDSGAPLAGNHFKGEATLITPATGSVSKYNAIGFLGTENNGDGTLVLGGGQCVGGGGQQGDVCQTDEQCGESGPCAREYNGCPEVWSMQHNLEGFPPTGPGPVGPEFNEVTVVPCTQNFETQNPEDVTIQFLSSDDFESKFSVSTTVTCWGSFLISELGSPILSFAPPGSAAGDTGSAAVQEVVRERLITHMRPSGGTPESFLILQEKHFSTLFRELHPLTGSAATGNSHLPENVKQLFENDVWSAAGNAHWQPKEGEGGRVNIVTIPAEQLAR